MDGDLQVFSGFEYFSAPKQSPCPPEVNAKRWVVKIPDLGIEKKHEYNKYFCRTINWWYTIGIIIDRIGVVLFQRFLNPKKVLIKNGWIAKNAKENKSDTRIALMLREGNLSSYLDYYRSRVRIMRFTVLNIFLTTIALIVFVYTGCSASICISKNPIVFWIATIGIIIVVVTWAILGMLEIGFNSRVEQAQFALKQAGENKNH